MAEGERKRVFRVLRKAMRSGRSVRAQLLGAGSAAGAFNRSALQHAAGRTRTAQKTRNRITPRMPRRQTHRDRHAGRQAACQQQASRFRERRAAATAGEGRRREEEAWGLRAKLSRARATALHRVRLNW